MYKNGQIKRDGVFEFQVVICGRIITRRKYMRTNRKIVKDMVDVISEEKLKKYRIV